MKIEVLDKVALRHVENLVNAKLREVAAETGLDLRWGGGRFTPANATIKLLISTRTSGGLVKTKESEDFLYYAPYLRVKKEALNQRFSYEGRPYIFIGYLPKSRKYPFLATNAFTGNRIKFSARLMSELLPEYFADVRDLTLPY